MKVWCLMMCRILYVLVVGGFIVCRLLVVCCNECLVV